MALRVYVFEKLTAFYHVICIVRTKTEERWGGSSGQSEYGRIIIVSRSNDSG